MVVPALNAAASLQALLPTLRQYVAEVVVVDGGSDDGTAEVAERLGARVVAAERGRGQQLAAGAEAAQRQWLLFLHADTRLQEPWAVEVRRFIGHPENRNRGACFEFRLDDATSKARRLERLVNWRCRRFGLPYGDQGLLAHRSLYERAGGFRPIPLMEDVDLIRRIGRGNIVVLEADAITSARRYRRDGYWRRPARNLCLLSLYWLGVPPRLLVKAYG